MKKFLFLLAVISVVSCNKKTNEFNVKQDVEKTSLMVKANAFFKSITSLPYEDIPDDKVALGKKLYFDTRLSKDGSISCNSCHNLNTFGVDNLPTSPGDTKMFGDRNSPTVIYASLHSNQFWDGRAKDVEEQAGMPILNPVEHNIPSEDFLVARLKEIPEYVAMFKKVYSDQQDPITYDNLTNAIGAFERKLIPISRFDLWLDGDDQSLTDVEKKGLNAFIDNGCIACHSGVALGGNTMQKFGLYGDYWEHTNSKKIDMGLYDITKKEADKYVFKSPSMRNIAKTYPYFHDGSVESLYDAVKIMGLLQSNIVLTDEDTKNIVAFLEALTADVDEIYKE
jgi:cytochrome c peroxidase